MSIGFFLGEDDVRGLLTKIRNNGNIYDVIPGLKDKFLERNDVMLDYGVFFEHKNSLIDQKCYNAGMKQAGGLLLPYYQVFLRGRMESGGVELELDDSERAVFIRALTEFPEVKKFHRALGFELKPVEAEDIILDAEQLKIG